MLFRPGKKSGVSARERSLWADLASMGFVFPIAIALGFFLGRWVGDMAGHPKLGSLIGLALGILTGFWELFKVTKRLEKHDALSEPSNGSNGSAESGDPKGDKDV